MPYIYENGVNRYVTQEEFVAWGKANGLPTPTKNSGTYNPPVGGEKVVVSSPASQYNMSKTEYREARDSQIKQAEGELDQIDMKLAKASTGQTSLSSGEIAALEQRKEALGNNINDLYDGKLVTDGSLSGGRVANEGIVPNTSSTIPDQTIPTTYASAPNNDPVTDSSLPTYEIAEQPVALVDLTTGEADQQQEVNDADIINQALPPSDDPSANFQTVDVDAEGNLIQREQTLDEILADNPIEADPYAQQADAALNQDQLASALAGGGDATAAALTEQARTQQAVRDQQQQQASAGDWRVKLRLAPGANYLYRAGGPSGSAAGIMQPLAVTDGVVFPYMPRISTSYSANYNTQDLTHSNYRNAFYQNSYVGDISIEADFTAQDTYEANYLLAVIHFFRSATKMFYGQDAQRGTPPPLVYIQGLGQYQFNLQPCVIKEFTYSLPNDVDYIRAQVKEQLGFNTMQGRTRQTLPTNVFASALQRLQNAGLVPGGAGIGTTQMSSATAETLGTKDPTYVPTKMSMTIVLMPMQSRTQISKEFSLQKFADGTLIKKGFW